MRITMVSPYDPNPPQTEGRRAVVGGVERVYAETARHLAARGHDVTMVCSTDGEAHVTRESGVTMVRRPRHFTIMRAPVAGLARAIPDDSEIVQVAATYPFTTPDVLRWAKRASVPSILDFHFEPNPSSSLGYLGASAYRRLGPRAYGLAEAVLVRSMAYGRSAPSLHAVPEDKWRIVPNGIDTERFKPAGHVGDGDYLLFVGRLVPYKGLDILLRAMKCHPPGLPLVIAGDGPERGHLEALAARLSLKVTFLGRVSDDQLPDLYRKAALTVLPSINRQEAFGISILESMACGTPVVASDLPGVAQVARLGGMVAPPGNPALLGAQIRRALESDRLPRGATLASSIHAKFSWDAVTDRLETVYVEVLRRRGVIPANTVAAASASGEAGDEVTAVARTRGHPVL